MDLSKSTKRKLCGADNEVPMDKKQKTKEKRRSTIDGWKLRKHKQCESVSDEKRIVTITPEGRRESQGPNNGKEKEEEREKKLFFCCEASSTNSSAIWYKIDPNINSPTKANGKMKLITDLSPICELISSSQTALACTPVALGSEIYVVGGWNDDLSEATNNVSCLGTTEEPSVFREKLPSVHAKRRRPKAVASHGKIYVFGSLSESRFSPNPWAEVFDPYLNQWSPLPEPPHQVTNATNYSLTSIIVVGDKILLYVDWNVVSFDVVTNTWELITTPLPYIYSSTIFDGLSFEFRKGQVVAYDLVEQKWLDKPVQGLGIRKCSTFSPDYLMNGYVFDLGNNSLCVLWDECTVEKTIVRCIKFRVARAKGSRGRTILRAEIESRASYRLSGRFERCVAL